MPDEPKKPKRFVTIVTNPEKLVIGDPDISDAERKRVREAVTMLRCPMCKHGLVTVEEFKRWRRAATEPPPEEPEPA